LLPAPKDVSEAELPLPIELERPLGLVVFALAGVVSLIGVMLPGLLGVVMPALEALLLPGLLLRGTKSVAETAGDGEPSDFPDASSRGADIVVLWLFGRELRMPMLDSARPPA
jgi:hypothetical protein